VFILEEEEEEEEEEKRKTHVNGKMAFLHIRDLV
jgi:hypothetical protein